MRKYFALAGALTALMFVGYGVNQTLAGPPPPVGNCANVTVGSLSPDTSDGNASNYLNVTSGDHATAGKGTWSVGCTSWAYDFYNGATLLQSGTSNLFYPTSSNYGDVVTVTVWGCDVNDNCESVDDSGQSNVLGAGKLWDDFNGSNGTKPTIDADSDGDSTGIDTDSDAGSDWWTTRTDSGGHLTFEGTSLMSESGSGFLQMNVQYNDQDSDGDSTSSSDSDTSSCTAGYNCEPSSDDGVGDWQGTYLQSAAALTGARYAETRLYVPCVDNDTGWNNSEGWEYASFQSPGYDSGSGLSYEVDLFGQRSKTTYGNPSTGGDTESDSDGDDSSGDYSDYLVSPALQTWAMTGSFDGDHDGDSVSSDTDGTITITDQDSTTGDESEGTTSESLGHGDTWNYIAPSPLHENATKTCGTWNVYGAKITAHEVSYYFNGTNILNAYTNSTYGTPALGVSSTVDLTTVPLRQIFSIGAYQDPPAGAANTYMDIDYIHVNSLS